MLGASGSRVTFADDLVGTTRAADAKLARLLNRIDAYAVASGLGNVHDTDAASARPISMRS